MKSKLGETNKEDGDAFLAENGKSEGVVTLPSGLQYKVDMTGTGKKPTSGQQCPVRFLQRGDYAKKT
jgi:FKBP-type peptidyl-prolyl cis-trans isomerase FklB